MSKLIIIPDVHGRSFWKKAVKENTEEEFIFLGDYLDPYRQDGVTVDEAFDGLQDIVALKKCHPEQFSLLWGNHDLHYLYPELEGSRLDHLNAARNEAFFRRHEKCFQIASERAVSGQRYLFTHAGVGRLWIESFLPSCPEEQITAVFLNEAFQLPAFIKALSAVSYYRGGPELYGSCIGADLQEQSEFYNQMESAIQVFGHTMVLEAFNYENRIYGLDCQECFYLDLEKGGIYALDSGKPVPLTIMR